MKKIMLIAALAGTLFSCGNNPNKKTVEEVINDAEETIEDFFEDAAERLKLKSEYIGVFEGNLPCADCERTEVTLTINENHTFSLKTVWVSGKEGQENIVEELEGDYLWTSEGNIITLNGIGDRPNKYLMEDGMLIQLDIEGKRITGPNADKYVLKKLK